MSSNFLHSEEILKVENINKNYGRNQILQDINFSVQKNEIFGIVGLNGAGKTTLIKIIVNLISGSSGSFEISENKKIFYLPEKFQPSPLLTGFEFVQFSNSFFKIQKSEQDVSEFFEYFAIDKKFLHKKIKSFSKGMGQKIGLICAFMSDAEILILDEPMSGLDPLARIALKKEIINYQKLGKTILFSSHVLSDVEEICNRIMLIFDKKVNFIGKTEELLQQTGQNSLEQAFLQKISG